MTILNIYIMIAKDNNRYTKLKLLLSWNQDWPLLFLLKRKKGSQLIHAHNTVSILVSCFEQLLFL